MAILSLNFVTGRKEQCHLALSEVGEGDLKSFQRVSVWLSPWSSRNGMRWSRLRYLWCIGCCVQKGYNILASHSSTLGSFSDGPRLLSCFSLSPCPLFYTLSVSSLSVFSLLSVVNHIAVCMQACISPTPWTLSTSGVTPPLNKSCGLEDQASKLVRVVCKVRVHNPWVWSSCAVLWGCSWVSWHLWNVPQLSASGVFVACVPIVLSLFWISMDYVF